MAALTQRQYFWLCNIAHAVEVEAMQKRLHEFERFFKIDNMIVAVVEVVNDAYVFCVMMLAQILAHGHEVGWVHLPIHYGCIG